jgi:hypothetical protein
MLTENMADYSALMLFRDPSIKAGGHASCTSMIRMATPSGLWRASVSTQAQKATPNKSLDASHDSVFLKKLL